MRGVRVLVVALLGAATAAAATSPAPTYLRPHEHRPVVVARSSGVASVSDAPVRVGEQVVGSARVARTGISGFEPTLGAVGETVVFSAFDDEGNPLVGRSRDGGRTWQLVGDRVAGQNTHAASLDTYLHVDPGSRRLFHLDLLGPCSVLSRSDDLGTSWETTTLPCGQGVNDHQNLFTGPGPGDSGRVVYYCWNTLAASFCARSLDGGTTFLPAGAPIYEVADPSQPSGTHDVPGLCLTPAIGHGTTGPGGEVYVPRGHCGRPMLAISRDQGLTWERVLVSPTGVASIGGDPSHEASVAVARDGTLLYAWIAADRLPSLAVSRDGGRTWSPRRVVAPRGVVQTRMASMAVAADGTVALSFLGSRDAPRPPVPGEGNLEDGGQQHYRDTTWQGFVMTGRYERPPARWRTVEIGTRADPLVRGACGLNRCSRLGDFLDVQVNGRTAWAVTVDTCVHACARRTRRENDANEAVVIRVPLGR